MHTPQPSKLVIVKKIRNYRQLDYNKFIQFVRSEFMIWSILGEHRNIVSLLGLVDMTEELANFWGGSKDTPTDQAVAHYYQGGSIRGFLARGNHHQNHTLKLEMLVGIARGLDHMHNNKIVHGDLKAVNVIINNIGGQITPKLTDFGSSSLDCWCHASPEDASRIGTMAWDSPELCDDGPRTIHTDVWAFGCTALEVQLGILPYGGIAEHRIVLQLSRGILPANEDCIPEGLRDEPILEEVWKVIQRCWELRPEGRPSASDLVEDLTGIYNNQKTASTLAVLAPSQ